MQPDNTYDYLFKMLLVGASGVGKSSILLRFTDDTWGDDISSTIGVDFKIKTLDVQNKVVKLQIWDTAGQERFKSVCSAYYKGAHGVGFVYDVTDKESLRDLDDWISNVTRLAGKDIGMVLLGNKTDLDAERAVSYEEGQRFAEKYGMQFLETSAKNSNNVHEAFEKLAIDMKEKLGHKGTTKPAVKQATRVIDLENGLNVDKKKRNCCGK